MAQTLVRGEILGRRVFHLSIPNTNPRGDRHTGIHSRSQGFFQDSPWKVQQKSSVPFPGIHIPCLSSMPKKLLKDLATTFNNEVKPEEIILSTALIKLFTFSLPKSDQAWSRTQLPFKHKSNSNSAILPNFFIEANAG
jgi:hypothetical protein